VGRRRVWNDEPFAASVNALQFMNPRLAVVDVDRLSRGLRKGNFASQGFVDLRVLFHLFG
jgi:hypothetical protein